MVDSSVLLEQCAPLVSAPLMHALVRVESAWRPLAIGMDAGQTPVQQPQTMAQAVAQAKALASQGRGFSVGLAQIHVGNVMRYGMSWEQAFDPCANLKAAQRVFLGFAQRALAAGYVGLAATSAALRGFNAGAIDRAAGDSYARRILGYAHGARSLAQPNVNRPSIMLTPSPVTVPKAGFGGGLELGVRPAPSDEALDLFAKRPAIAGF